MVRFRTGDAKGAKALLDSVGTTSTGLYVAAVAAVHGVDAAERHLQNLGQGQPVTAQRLLEAAVLFAGQRDLERATALAERCNRLAPGAGAKLAAMKPWDEVELHGASSAMMLLARAALDPEVDLRSLRKIFPKGQDFDEQEVLDTLGKGMDTVGMADDAFLDTMATAVHLVEEAPGVGARLRVGNDKSLDFFAQDQRGWRLVAFANVDQGRLVADKAVEALEAGELEAGRTWLRWALDVRAGHGAAEAFQGHLDREDPEQLLWLARVLATGPDDPLPEMPLEQLPEGARPAAIELMAGLVTRFGHSGPRPWTGWPGTASYDRAPCLWTSMPMSWFGADERTKPAKWWSSSGRRRTTRRWRCGCSSSRPSWACPWTRCWPALAGWRPGSIRPTRWPTRSPGSWPLATRRTSASGWL